MSWNWHWYQATLFQSQNWFRIHNREGEINIKNLDSRFQTAMILWDTGFVADLGAWGAAPPCIQSFLSFFYKDYKSIVYTFSLVHSPLSQFPSDELACQKATERVHQLQLIYIATLWTGSWWIGGQIKQIGSLSRQYIIHGWSQLYKCASKMKVAHLLLSLSWSQLAG